MRLADGSQILGELGLAYLRIQTLDPADFDETYKVQRSGKRFQQRAVECREQDEARGTSWSSTTSVSISSRLDLALPLDTGGLGRDGAQLFLTLIKVIAQVISHFYPIPSSSTQVLW